MGKKLKQKKKNNDKNPDWKRKSKILTVCR